MADDGSRGDVLGAGVVPASYLALGWTGASLAGATEELRSIRGKRCHVAAAHYACCRSYDECWTGGFLASRGVTAGAYRRIMDGVLAAPMAPGDPDDHRRDWPGRDDYLFPQQWLVDEFKRSYEGTSMSAVPLHSPLRPDELAYLPQWLVMASCAPAHGLDEYDAFSAMAFVLARVDYSAYAANGSWLVSMYDYLPDVFWGLVRGVVRESGNLDGTAIRGPKFLRDVQSPVRVTASPYETLNVAYPMTIMLGRFIGVTSGGRDDPFVDRTGGAGDITDAIIRRAGEPRPCVPDGMRRDAAVAGLAGMDDWTGLYDSIGYVRFWCSSSRYDDSSSERRPIILKRIGVPVEDVDEALLEALRHHDHDAIETIHLYLRDLPDTRRLAPDRFTYDAVAGFLKGGMPPEMAAEDLADANEKPFTKASRDRLATLAETTGARIIKSFPRAITSNRMHCRTVLRALDRIIATARGMDAGRLAAYRDDLEAVLSEANTGKFLARMHRMKRGYVGMLDDAAGFPANMHHAALIVREWSRNKPNRWTVDAKGPGGRWGAASRCVLDPNTRPDYAQDDQPHYADNMTYTDAMHRYVTTGEGRPFITVAEYLQEIRDGTHPPFC